LLWRTAVFPLNVFFSTEEMNSLAGEAEVKEPVTNGITPDEDTMMHESSDLSDVPSEDGSETASDWMKRLINSSVD
jgi:hypothetical protein